MKIPAIQPYNQRYNKQIKHSKTNKQYQGESEQNKQISFRAVSIVSASFVAGKTISAAMKCKDIRKRVSIIENAFQAPQKNIKDLASAVLLLSKTKEHISFLEDIGESANILSVRPSINNLQYKALDEIFPLMDDNDGGNRVAKISLMEEIYNSGNYLNDDYIEAFDNLSDKFYKGFKQNLVEKALNPIHEYNPSDESSQFLYNLRLVKSIEKDEYKDYLQNVIPEYKNLLKTIDLCALKNLTEKRNNAYLDYSTDFNNEGIWKNNCQKVFYSIVGYLGNDIANLAKKLNIDEICAKDIISDLKARSDAEKTNDIEEKIKILSKRLDEKFAKGLVIPPERADKDIEVYYSLHLYLDNIHSFINKTDFKNEFEKFYKPELDNLTDKMENAKARDEYEYESRMARLEYLAHQL